MIMTELNVIDMCDVYEPRVPRERVRGIVGNKTGSLDPVFFLAYFVLRLMHYQRPPFNPRAL